MRFRGHTATWWKQLKTTRSHNGKTPIQSWDKLTKLLRQTFLPHNYERTMYTRLQNLRQGSRTVDEYAEEFALLLTRNEINDSQISWCHGLLEVSAHNYKWQWLNSILQQSEKPIAVLHPLNNNLVLLTGVRLLHDRELKTRLPALLRPHL